MLKQSWLLHVINWLLSIYDTSLYSSNKAYLTYCYKYFISLWVKVIFSILCHIFFNRKYHHEAAITLVYFGLHYSAHVRYWWCVISSGKSRGCHVDWWLADPLWVCLETSQKVVRVLTKSWREHSIHSMGTHKDNYFIFYELLCLYAGDKSVFVPVYRRLAQCPVQAGSKVKHWENIFKIVHSA